MNVHQLRVFVLTVQEKKLAVVADTLGVSQPTVSFHLKKLQDDLGMPLFVSGTHRLLTEAGKVFYHYARQMIGMEEHLAKTMQEWRDVRAGHLSLGATYTPATYMLPAHLAAFKRAHPDLTIKFEVNNENVLIGMIHDFELDLAILSNMPEDAEGLILKPIDRDEMILVVSPRMDGWKGKERLELADIPVLPLIMHEERSMSRKIIEEWASRNRIPLLISMVVSATETMKELVKQGVGGAILSERSCRREVQSGELLGYPVPAFAVQRQCYLAYRKDKLMTPAMNRFIAMLPDEL